MVTSTIWSPPVIQGPENTEYITERQIDGNYQVQANKTINDPRGKRFLVRGVQMFDYSMVSFEPRYNQTRRNVFQKPENLLPAPPESEPSYGARRNWVSYEWATAQMEKAKKMGVNMLRVPVEPAVQFCYNDYVDPIDGKIYPSDHKVLDHIMNECERLGLVCQLTGGRDQVSNAELMTFMRWLVQRYHTYQCLWINPNNEPGNTADGGAHIVDPVWWAAQAQSAVTALREPIPGTNGKRWDGLITLDVPGYSHRLDLVVDYLRQYGTFKDDPNLAINIHCYGGYLENSFIPRISAPNGSDYLAWYRYKGEFCLIMGEVGIDNFGGLDPALTESGVSSDPANWVAQQAFMGTFWRWLDSQSKYAEMSGGVARLWFAGYDGGNPSGFFHIDGNSLMDVNGNRTTYGAIVQTYFYAPIASWQYERIRLGSQADGTWGPGDIQNGAIITDKIGTGAVTDVKLAAMPANTVKGTGTGQTTPTNLTRTALSQALWGLGATAVSAGPLGTPLFQIEGQTGARAAAVLIQQGVSDAYLGFYNRTTGAAVGTVSGNGTTGVTYGTTSDYRTKINVKTANPVEALEKLLKVRVVTGNYIGFEDKEPEYMHLAHELQEHFPGSVTGEKDQITKVVDEEGNEQIFEVMQNVDYGKQTPIIIAAVQALVSIVKTQAEEIKVLQDNANQQK